MRYLLGTIGLVFILVLSGCATLSKSECQTGDWRNVGEIDGRAGYSSARFGEHNEACSKHGISIDRDLYQQGYQSGLTQYCTTDNAAKVGIAGRSYANVCTGEIGLSFVRVYREANDIYTIDQAISSLQSSISEKTEKLVSDILTPAERENLGEDIKALNRDLSSRLQERSREDAELRQVLIEEQTRLSNL